MGIVGHKVTGMRPKVKYFGSFVSTFYIGARISNIDIVLTHDDRVASPLCYISFATVYLSNF